MKKVKIFTSILSIISCGLFMFGLFSASALGGSEQVNIRLDNVKKEIYSLNNIISPKKGNIVSEGTGVNVYLGGYPIGLKLYADGVVIVGTEAVDTSKGNINAAEEAGLKIGDIIKKVNGNEVKSNSSVSNIIEQSNGEIIDFEILREGKAINITFKSLFSVSENKYKAGIWIRDSSAGIGTVTFCTDNGYFASLGHAVCDIDTKKIIPVSEGESTTVNITGFKKATTGSTGEICGFLENNNTGKVYYNGNIGVYGEFNSLPNTPMLPIANKEEIMLGEASVFTTLENDIKEEYKIEITSLDFESRDNKNMVIKIIDNNLLQKTGGIIQGMSGSPIVQNGKIIGAVTHVFLNDATGGYGIFAETMLKNAEYIAEINGE